MVDGDRYIRQHDGYYKLPDNSTYTLFSFALSANQGFRAEVSHMYVWNNAGTLEVTTGTSYFAGMRRGTGTPTLTTLTTTWTANTTAGNLNYTITSDSGGIVYFKGDTGSGYNVRWLSKIIVLEQDTT